MVRPLGWLGVVITAFAYAFCLVRVHGISMAPTYRSGRWLLVRHMNWPVVPLRDGEVIVFRHEGQLLIKRIAALPGERPPIENLLLLRFRPAHLPKASGEWAADMARLFEPIPAGQVYVLGDNAEHSEDSRDFGAVPLSAVVGRVIQWNLPDPPERVQIGYHPRGCVVPFATVPDKAGREQLPRPPRRSSGLTRASTRTAMLAGH